MPGACVAAFSKMWGRSGKGSRRPRRALGSAARPAHSHPRALQAGRPVLSLGTLEAPRVFLSYSSWLFPKPVQPDLPSP